jgi:hypothetical protein
MNQPCLKPCFFWREKEFERERKREGVCSSLRGIGEVLATSRSESAVLFGGRGFDSGCEWGVRWECVRDSTITSLYPA